jgi:hypothetical protein
VSPPPLPDFATPKTWLRLQNIWRTQGTVFALVSLVLLCWVSVYFRRQEIRIAELMGDRPQPWLHEVSRWLHQPAVLAGYCGLLVLYLTLIWLQPPRWSHLLLFSGLFITTLAMSVIPSVSSTLIHDTVLQLLEKGARARGLIP